MAIYRVRPGAPAGGDGSLNTPFNDWAQVTWAPGNQYLGYPGLTYVGAACSPGASGSAGAPITIGTYDPVTGAMVTDGSMRAIIRNSGVTNIVGVGSGRSWITIDGIEVVGSGRTSASSENAIGLQTTGVGQCIVRNCLLHDVPGGGVFVQPGLNAYPVGWLIERNEVYNCGSTGILWVGSGYGWAIVSNKVHDTGYKIGSFGISCYPHRYSGSLTWTLTGGTVYQATLADQGSENPLNYIETVYFSGGAGWNLKETTGAVSAPASGEYGYDPATRILYVNIGADPTGRSLSLLYGRMRGWRIEGNEVWDTDNWTDEGNGIQADDGSGYGFVTRNHVHGRVNHGIAGNIAHDTVFAANVCEVSKGNGLRGGNGRSNRFYGNAVVSTATAAACIYFDGSDAGGAQDLSNNILVGGTYGVQRGAGGGTNSGSTNCIYGQITSAASGIALTGTVAQDPQLDNAYRPQNVALRGGGTRIRGRDFYGKDFWSPPTIGAVQVQNVIGVSSRRGVAP